MAEQVAQLLNEKCKVLEMLGKCQQEVGIDVDGRTRSGRLNSQLRPNSEHFRIYEHRS